MDLKQAAAIVNKLRKAYDKNHFLKPEELQGKVDLYCIYFADIPYRIVDKEVDEWIKTQKDMPSISELLSKCKDALILERSPKFSEDIKPTWWYILEAQGVDMDAPVPPEISAMTDQLIEAMRNDPRMKARHEQEQKQKNSDGFMPFEI